MDHLRSLLESIPIPAARTTPDRDEREALLSTGGLVHELGADLPAGHVHVWGGPSGSGKTSLLLALLQSAARRGRTVVYVTYDLAPPSLALRMLAMLAGVPVQGLPDPGGEADAHALSDDELQRLGRVKAALMALPFYVLPARGLSVASIADRLVRTPDRPEVIVVDYVQAVVREPGQPLGAALQEFSDLAVHLHLGVLCVFRPTEAPGARAEDRLRDPATADGVHAVADRVGWIAPEGDEGLRRAEIVTNRYGATPSVPLRFDPATGTLRRSRPTEA